MDDSHYDSTCIRNSRIYDLTLAKIITHPRGWAFPAHRVAGYYADDPGTVILRNFRRVLSTFETLDLHVWIDEQKSVKAGNFFGFLAEATHSLKSLTISGDGKLGAATYDTVYGDGDGRMWELASLFTKRFQQLQRIELRNIPMLDFDDLCGFLKSNSTVQNVRVSGLITEVEELEPEDMSLEEQGKKLTELTGVKKFEIGRYENF